MQKVVFFIEFVCEFGIWVFYVRFDFEDTVIEVGGAVGFSECKLCKCDTFFENREYELCFDALAMYGGEVVANEFEVSADGGCEVGVIFFRPLERQAAVLWVYLTRKLGLFVADSGEDKGVTVGGAHGVFGVCWLVYLCCFVGYSGVWCADNTCSVGQNCFVVAAGGCYFGDAVFEGGEVGGTLVCLEEADGGGTVLE